MDTRYRVPDERYPRGWRYTDRGLKRTRARKWWVAILVIAVAVLFIHPDAAVLIFAFLVLWPVHAACRDMNVVPADHSSGEWPAQPNPVTDLSWFYQHDRLHSAANPTVLLPACNDVTELLPLVPSQQAVTSMIPLLYVPPPPPITHFASWYRQEEQRA